MGKNSLMKSTSKKKSKHRKTIGANKKITVQKTVSNPVADKPKIDLKKPPEQENTSEKPNIEKKVMKTEAKPFIEEQKIEKQKPALEPVVIYNLPSNITNSNSLKKSTKWFVAGFVIVFVIMLVASFLNTHKYYLKVTDNAVEIWKGVFAPMGKTKLISIEGMQPPEPIQTVYSKDAVFVLAFNYYVKSADALLDAKDCSDFKKIKFKLNKALLFSNIQNSINMVNFRLNSIELITLFYKADISASAKTISGCKVAIAYLNKALSLKLDKTQIELIKYKIKLTEELMMTVATKT